MTIFMWMVGALAAAGSAAEPGARLLPDVRLEVGSTALVSIKPDGKANVSVEPAAALTAGELDILAQVVGRSEEAMGENSVGVSTDRLTRPIQPDEVRFSFVRANADQHTLLVISTGLNRSFAYTAHIRVGGRTERTDVCQVIPGRMAIEHWPYRIESIEITEVRAAEWADGAKPRCE